MQTRPEPRGLDRGGDAARRVDRIEKEKINSFEEDNSHARNIHSAVFAEVKVDEQLGIIG